MKTYILWIILWDTVGLGRSGESGKPLYEAGLTRAWTHAKFPTDDRLPDLKINKVPDKNVELIRSARDFSLVPRKLRGIPTRTTSAAPPKTPVGIPSKMTTARPTRGPSKKTTPKRTELPKSLQTTKNHIQQKTNNKQKINNNNENKKQHKPTQKTTMKKTKQTSITTKDNNKQTTHSKKQKNPKTHRFPKITFQFIRSLGGPQKL